MTLLAGYYSPHFHPINALGVSISVLTFVPPTPNPGGVTGFIT